MKDARSPHLPGFASRGLGLLILCLACSGAIALHAQTAPTITGFSPGNGTVGSTVVIDGTNFIPPLSITFGGNVQAGGNFTSTEITVTVPFGAQTGVITVAASGGKASTASVFTIGGTVTPAVSVVATVASVVEGSGQDGEFTFSIPAAIGTDLDIVYTVGGTAVNGTDYSFLKGSTTIKAGRTSKTIKVVPEGDLEGASKATVKVALTSGNGYTIGTPATAKVKILAAD